MEWVALAGLPSESVPVVCAVLKLLDCDGEELLLLPAKILQKMLAKSGADDATVLAKQALEQRDALTGDDSAAKVNDQPLCEICFLTFSSAEQRAPRILPCGHTFCESCLNDMVRTNKKKGKINCPSCRVEVAVPKGDASRLPKNFIAEC